jgi:hypothetical protein
MHRNISSESTIRSRSKCSSNTHVVKGLDSTPRASASVLSFLFFLFKCHSMIAATAMPRHAKAIYRIIAIVKRGASLSGKKYGE